MVIPEEGLMLHGVKYHPLDFVYLNLSSSASQVYTLAQIQEFTLCTSESGYSVTVKLLERCVDLEEEENSKRRRNATQV